MGLLRQSGIIKASTALPNPVPLQNMARPTMAYYNHNGTTENYLTKTVTGNATGTTTGHQMDLTTGTGAAGIARYHTASKVDLADTDIANVVLTFFITGLADGAGVDRYTQIGFNDDFTLVTLENFTGFVQLPNNTWYVVRGMGTGNGYTSSAVSAFSNGDVLSMIINNQKTIFLKNGVIIYTLVALGTDIVGTGYSGSAVNSTAATVSGARTVSISYIGFETYALFAGK